MSDSSAAITQLHDPSSDLERRPGRSVLPYVRILNILGGSGEAIAYLAAWRRPGQGLVVVKRWHRASRVRDWPEIEVRGLLQLAHRHVAAVHDVGVDTEHHCYSVTDYVAGSDIVSASSRGGSLADATLLILQLIEALDYVHGRGVYHLNLKPSNVLVSHTSGVKLVDFAAATPTVTLRHGAGALDADRFAATLLARDVLDRVAARSTGRERVAALDLARRAVACATPRHGLGELRDALTSAGEGLVP